MDKVKKALMRVQYNSPVILTYTLISALALALGKLTGNWTTTHLFSVYSGSLLDPLFYLRLVGHIFGHADFSHFFNNFIIILLAGPMLEERYGAKRMVYMCLVTALITGVFHAITADTALLGASGVGFMMILLCSFVNLERGRVPMTLILCIIVFIGREVVDGVAQTDNISQLTHIIGGVCGASFGFLVNYDKLRKRRP